MKSDWKKVSEYLKLALGFVVPQDCTETAFFFLKLSEIVDVASNHVLTNETENTK